MVLTDTHRNKVPSLRALTHTLIYPLGSVHLILPTEHVSWRSIWSFLGSSNYSLGHLGICNVSSTDKAQDEGDLCVCQKQWKPSRVCVSECLGSNCQQWAQKSSTGQITELVYSVEIQGLSSHSGIAASLHCFSLMLLLSNDIFPTLLHGEFWTLSDLGQS